MRKTFSVLAVLTAGVLAGCNLNGATPQNTTLTAVGLEQDVAQSATRWFIGVDSKVTVQGLGLQSVQTQQARVLSAMRASGIKFQVQRQFSKLWSGYVVQASADQARQLRFVEGVTSVDPVLNIPIPETKEVVSPDLVTSTAMIQAPNARNIYSVNGTGIKVGIIDTGIDLQHPAFAGRIAGGYDWVGDTYNANDANNNVPQPDNDPDDCGGHGSHVAGIAAANDTATPFQGVAPNATLYAYKVFGCTGTVASDIPILAMERAVADGVDIVNLSLGSAFGNAVGPSAIAVDRLSLAGITVVMSAGNSGTGGLYAHGSPGISESAISVANVENTSVLQTAISISRTGFTTTAFGYGTMTGSPAVPTSGLFAIARVGTPNTTAALACNSSPPAAGSLTGRVALIQRGTCGFYEKVINAQNAGAVAAVIYNNQAGFIGGTVAPTPPAPATSIPSVVLTQADGLAIDAQIALGTTNLTWTATKVAVPNPAGALMDTSSSFGPGDDLNLKPDVTAPGGSIYSTYPLEKGGYTTLSGTSMASPPVAGAVALLMQANPSLKGNPRAIRALLQNTAAPVNLRAAPAFLEHVQRQGAGMIQVLNALSVHQSVAPSRIPLGEVESGSRTLTLSVKNSSTTPLTYAITHAAAASMAGDILPASATTTVTPIATPSASVVAFSTTSLTVASNSSATFDVTITAPTALALHGYFGGYVVLTPNVGLPLRVPYTGYKGDYQFPKFVPTCLRPFESGVSPTACTTANLPGAFLTEGNLVNVYIGDGAVFNLSNTANTPALAFSRYRPVRRVVVEVVNNDGSPVDPRFNKVAVADNLGRSSHQFSVTVLALTGGTVFAEKGSDSLVLPNGTYRFKISSLKALGDESNPAHWDVVTTANFTIARP
jgi:minor extracellular serine protease Vpr